MTVRTRFAPSPTGVLHIGSVRTALFSWLYARGRGGQFVLRIEDTDRERSTQASVDAILEGMAWLGLDADEGPIYQSQRDERYREVIDAWLASGTAYRCYCTRDELEARREAQIARGEKPRYDNRCRDGAKPRDGVDPVVRFRSPQSGEVVVDDRVRGRVSFDNAELDDLIIARSDGSPTYNFTVVVDDADMQITHVIRGDDHLNNTPRQMNMLAALGAAPPVYAHLPMILGPDGGKLSKRHGAVDVLAYREGGFLPEALINYLARLGWSHGDQEIFSLDELTRLFDVDDVNHSASSFDPAKMRWLNQQYIIAADAARLGPLLAQQLATLGIDVASGPAPELVADAYRERADTLLEMAEACRYCYEDFEAIDPGAAKKHLRPVVLEPLRALRQRLAGTSWAAPDLGDAVRTTAEDFGINMGKLGQPVRVAVTGGSASPSLDITLALIGRDRVLKRLDTAIGQIEARAAAV